MNKLFLFVISVLFNFHLTAQADSIIAKDGRRIPCTIHDENERFVTFFSIGSDSTKLRSILKTDITKIKYLKISDRKENKTPFINISVGCGASHGYLGVQTILGYNNSGLILGTGTTEYATPLANTIGFQLAIKWFYVNAGIGTIGIYQINNDPVLSLRGRFVNLGTMINLHKKKRWYLEIAYGKVFYDQIPINYRYTYTYRVETFNATLAIGYRIGRLP